MSFTILQNIWWALIMIGVMILIHELGHYWAARFFDVKVDTFSFGFGPRLFGFKKGETDFRDTQLPVCRETDVSFKSLGYALNQIAV